MLFVIFIIVYVMNVNTVSGFISYLRSHVKPSYNRRAFYACFVWQDNLDFLQRLYKKVHNNNLCCFSSEDSSGHRLCVFVCSIEYSCRVYDARDRHEFYLQSFKEFELRSVVVDELMHMLSTVKDVTYYRRQPLLRFGDVGMLCLPEGHYEKYPRIVEHVAYVFVRGRGRRTGRRRKVLPKKKVKCGLGLQRFSCSPWLRVETGPCRVLCEK